MTVASQTNDAPAESVPPTAPSTSASSIDITSIKEGKDDREDSNLLYSTEEPPPWGHCTLLAIQQYIVFVGGTIATPLLVTGHMCLDITDPHRGDIVATVIFVSGIITLLQTTFGIRLPIVQGSNLAYVVPAITIITIGFPPCEDTSDMTDEERKEQWQIRMREVQGAIAVSSVVEVLLGMTGIIGVMLRYITPLTIVPTVTLVGLSLFSVGAEQASTHWGISILTIVLLVVVSQYMKNLNVPHPSYSRSKGVHLTRSPIFTYFPLLLVTCACWSLCGILTALDVFPEGSLARTDATGNLLKDAKWFRIPYPGQWGLPTVGIGGFVGMIAAVFASVVESIGDYYCCAQFTERITPPQHAVNRAVACEGIGCVLAGLFGTASGTASYTPNIVLIGITKVASRRVLQVSGLLMLLTGMCGKLCAVFASIPIPVLGSSLMFMFALITGVGLSSLQEVNLSSQRNLFILGFSIFFSVSIPNWLNQNPDAIRTGYAIIDQGFVSLLQTSIFLGGMLGMILDNTLPGTIEERGLTNWMYYQQSHSSSNDVHDVCYDLPFGMTYIRRWKWTNKIPFLPTFTRFRFRQKE